MHANIRTDGGVEERGGDVTGRPEQPPVDAEANAPRAPIVHDAHAVPPDTD